MLSSKKGISTILATLLLIVIAISAVAVTYAWVMVYTTTQTEGAIIVVENVIFYGEPATAKNRTDIVISNTGTANAKILRLYIGTSSWNLIEVSESSDLGTGKVVNAGGVITITVTWPIPNLATEWESEETYHFKVAPETVAPFDFVRKAP